MNSPLRFMLAVGGAFSVLGIAPHVLAGMPVSGNGVDPIRFSGTPTLQEVVDACPNDLPATFGDVLELVMNNPPNQGQEFFPQTVQFSNFRVRVTVNAGQGNTATYDVEDVSGSFNPLDAALINNQFTDTLGIDAVVIRGGGGGSSAPSNIYCQINNIVDTELGLPNLSKANSIAFYWVLGPCPLGPVPTQTSDVAENQAALDNVAAEYNDGDVSADVVQGFLDVENADDQITNVCGLTLTMRFCEPGTVPDDPNNFREVLTCELGGTTASQGQAVLTGSSPVSISGRSTTISR